MTCREAEKMVIPYIDGKLGEDELERFLKHISSCPSCMEELEIYYTVFQGLKQLDNESDNIYDIAGALEDSLEDSWVRVKTTQLRRVICYAADTLGLTGLATALILQLRIWLQMGLL
ncbi:MAG: zf-HC2 domain-containing protein [Clostridiales bacterium]|nr:zf-HC2 domain-containing protein [Clostridiales bacterium]